MTNYSLIDDVLKEKFKKEINNLANSVGGKNYFLQLIEEIRMQRPHVLISKEACFKYKYGKVKWEKVLYRDKVRLLLEILKKNNTNNQNLMWEKGQKRYKITLNLLRTLGPMRFKVEPKNNNDGPGFYISPLDIIDSKTTNINFMFEAIFFLPAHTVKQIFNGSKKGK